MKKGGAKFTFVTSKLQNLIKFKHNFAKIRFLFEFLLLYFKIYFLSTDMKFMVSGVLFCLGRNRFPLCLPQYSLSMVFNSDNSQIMIKLKNGQNL